MPRRRRHPVLKWTATVVAVLMLAFTVASFWFKLSIQTPRSYSVISGGSTIIDWSRTDLWWDNSWDIAIAFGFPWTELWFDWLVLPSWFQFGAGWWFEIPFWPFILLLGFLTIWLWRRDRRLKLPANHCQACGYNLTGNQSGVCPECGVAI